MDSVNLMSVNGCGTSSGKGRGCQRGKAARSEVDAYAGARAGRAGKDMADISRL